MEISDSEGNAGKGPVVGRTGSGVTLEWNMSFYRIMKLTFGRIQSIPAVLSEDGPAGSG